MKEYNKPGTVENWFNNREKHRNIFILIGQVGNILGPVLSMEIVKENEIISKKFNL